ncbi:MAG: TetR/AcrR family transcriptional regulator [Polyangiaceae bacterium]
MKGALASQGDIGVPRPRRQARAASSQDIVDAIVVATEELLVSEGYALTTNAVADRAGVSIGSLYQYFPDKHALVAEVARRVEQRGLELAMEAAARTDADADPRAITSEWVDIMLSPRLGSIALRRALLYEVPPVWAADAAAPTDGAVEAMLAALIAARPDAFREVDPHTLAFVAYHAVEGVVECVLIERPQQFGARALRDELFRLAWSFAAPEGAPLTPPPPRLSVVRHETPPRVTPPAPRRIEPSGRRGRETVEAILDAAAAILTEEGFDGLAARALARRAGVSAGTLYRYFPDVAAVATELARRCDGATSELFTQAFTLVAQGPLLEGLRGVAALARATAIDDVPLRHALLRQLPRAAYRDATSVSGELLFAAASDTLARAPRVRSGPQEWMAFIAVRAVERTIEAALLRRRSLDDDLVEAIVQLAYRYLRAYPDFS